MSEGAPGRFVGDRYHLVRELGRGGMGVVYLGRDLRLDMDVAIKFRGLTHHEATLWLKREFRAVASLRHPNLVELYELVANDRSCYFTMEYLPGLDPRHWVERRPHGDPRRHDEVRATDRSPHSATPLRVVPTERSEPPPTLPSYDVFARPVPAVDFARVRAVLTQLAEGVAFLHAHGVIHRDLKPSNVIVVDGAVKLLDFGLAIARGRLAEDLARENRIVGTAAYLAPEYLQRQEVTPKIDVYALGVVAYELCTGTPPFGGTLHLLARLHEHLRIPRVREVNPEVPADLDELIDAMLASEPDARPSALQLVERLTGTLSQPRATRRAPRFVGRTAELARLAAQIEAPAEHARLVLVTGPSGSGKTAVVDEAVGRHRGAHTVTWRARCHDRERVPYRAFDLIIDDLATQLAGDPRRAREVGHAAALGRVFPVLAPLIDPALAVEPAADLRVERERALIALTEMVSGLLTAARGVIAIDDLQWADDDSLELLALLVERVRRPLTVIASWTGDGTVVALPAEGAGPRRFAGGPRVEGSPSPHDRVAALVERLGARTEVIELPTMNERDLVKLIGELAPDAPTARVAAAARLAAGSPYLAELIGRELGETDIVDPQDAELRRLDRLAPVERSVAEIAALAGGTASFEDLRALAELPSSQLQRTLRALEDARVVRATPALAGDPLYVVYHQRLRETAHAAMTDRARRVLHEKFARWFERTSRDAGQLAYHWHHAGDRDRAAQAAIAAADAAQAQLAWNLAADWYARAIALGAASPLVREQLAQCLFLGGRLAAAADEFLTLARAASDGPDPSGDRWRVRAAEAYLKLGELDRGLRILDDVLERRGERRSRVRALAVVRALGVAARWLAPAPRRARAVDDVLASAYRVIASFLSTPYPIEALEYVLRGVALAERTGDRAGHAMGMAMLSAYLATGSLGRFGDRAIANARQLAVASGAPYPRMVAAGAAGMLATLRGDWAAMRAAHEEAEGVCKRLGLERSWEASFLRTYWALGELYAGEPARAQALLASLRDTNEDLWTRAMLGSCRGRVLVLAGQLDEARPLARELERSPAAQQGISSIYRQVFLGELALAEHDWARARAIGHALARSARQQWLSTMPAISAMIDVITATAELGLGDHAAAARARRIARRLYRRGRASFYAATALRLWSQAERLLGDPAASRHLLARAARVATQRGGRVDRLAIDALAGMMIDPGGLGAAVAWSTGSMVEGANAWHRR